MACSAFRRSRVLQGLWRTSSFFLSTLLLFLNSGQVTGPDGPGDERDQTRECAGKRGSKEVKTQEGDGPRLMGNQKLAETVESQE